MEATKECFRKEFGRDTDNLFEEFQEEPIASGSISQVYVARYLGEKVAVKVRHPDIERNIVRDVELLFTISNWLSKLHPIFELPITKSSLTKTLTDQLDFRIEQTNISKFNELFHWHHHVHFPKIK